jgi:hypothetical protein
LQRSWYYRAGDARKNRAESEEEVKNMSKNIGAAMLLGGMLFLGTIVTAQERKSESAIPQMQRMGPMMGMMADGERMAPMGEMGSMMEMMKGMMHMMDACNPVLGGSPSVEPEATK